MVDHQALIRQKGDQNQLEAIKSAGVLNVATSADFAPLSSML